jgi:hypothetical protein
MYSVVQTFSQHFRKTRESEVTQVRATRPRYHKHNCRSLTRGKSRVTRSCSVQGICSVTSTRIETRLMHTTMNTRYSHLMNPYYPLLNASTKYLKPWHPQSPKTATPSHQQVPSQPPQQQTSLQSPLQNTTTSSHYKRY